MGCHKKILSCKAGQAFNFLLMYFKKTGNIIVFIFCFLLLLGNATKLSASDLTTRKAITADLISAQLQQNQNEIQCNDDRVQILHESIPVGSIGFRIRHRFRLTRSNDFTALKSSDLFDCETPHYARAFKVYYNFSDGHVPYYYTFLFRLTPF